MESDPRFTLTEDEREHVMCLKQECDKHGVEYKSIFELAKYSLVCSSVSNPKKRLKESFQRIKRKREFEAKHKLDEFDLFSSLEVVEEGMPNWIQSCGVINGKWAIGYSGGEVDGKFITRNKHGFEHICVVEFKRYDLAAADLEEARKGMYIVVQDKHMKGNPIHHARMMMKMRVLFDKMNSNRVKGIFAVIPSNLGMLVNVVLRVMPSKVKERVVVSSDFAKMEKINIADSKKSLSEVFGGGYSIETKKWFEMRMATYAESVSNVQL